MTRKGYAAGTEMEGGYPAEADMLDYFQARGIELLTENNPNYILEFLKYLFEIMKSCFTFSGRTRRK